LNLFREHVNDYHFDLEDGTKEPRSDDEAFKENVDDSQNSLLYQKISREMDKGDQTKIEDSLISRSRAVIVDEETVEKKKIQNIKDKILSNFKSALERSEEGLSIDKKQKQTKGPKKPAQNMKKNPQTGKKLTNK